MCTKKDTDTHNTNTQCQETQSVTVAVLCHNQSLNNAEWHCRGLSESEKDLKQMKLHQY